MDALHNSNAGMLVRRGLACRCKAPDEAVRTQQICVEIPFGTMVWQKHCDHIRQDFLVANPPSLSDIIVLQLSITSSDPGNRMIIGKTPTYVLLELHDMLRSVFSWPVGRSLGPEYRDIETRLCAPFKCLT